MRLLKGLFSLVFSLVCLALGAQIQVGDTLRVAVFADMHVSPGTVADENLAQAIENVNKSGYDFVIVAGDVSNVGSDAELQNVYDKLKALQVPYFFVPGNHETNWSESACKTIIDLWKNDRFVVEDRLDAEFLELADEFAMKARRILAESPRRARRRARR